MEIIFVCSYDKNKDILRKGDIAVEPDSVHYCTRLESRHRGLQPALHAHCSWIYRLKAGARGQALTLNQAAATSFIKMPDPCCGSGKGKYCNIYSVDTSVTISQYMQLVHCLRDVSVSLRDSRSA